jgi:hypothetical protein
MTYDITQDSFTCCDFGDAEACFTPDPPRTTIDEIRVWDRTRTQNEILETMFALLSGTEEGLLGYWPMDEGAGQMTGDRAGTNPLQLGTSPEPDDHDPSWEVTDWLPPIPVAARTWGELKSTFK